MREAAEQQGFTAGGQRFRTCPVQQNGAGCSPATRKCIGQRIQGEEGSGTVVIIAERLRGDQCGQSGGQRDARGLEWGEGGHDLRLERGKHD